MATQSDQIAGISTDPTEGIQGDGKSGTPVMLDFASLTNEAAPTTGDKLCIWDGTNHLDVDWNQLPGAAGGEVNTVSNVGGGAEVSKAKAGVDFPFRTFDSADTSITITENTNTIDTIINKDVVNQITQNDESGTTYTLVLADADRVSVDIANAAANVVTVPTNASVAYPVGTVIDIMQDGAGQTTITGDTGVTINGVSAGSVAIQNQYGACRIRKTAADVWKASGDLFAGGGSLSIEFGWSIPTSVVPTSSGTVSTSTANLIDFDPTGQQSTTDVTFNTTDNSIDCAVGLYYARGEQSYNGSGGAAASDTRMHNGTIFVGNTGTVHASNRASDTAHAPTFTGIFDFSGGVGSIYIQPTVLANVGTMNVGNCHITITKLS